MFGSFPAGAFAVQIRTGGNLREFGKSFETVKVRIADRATTDQADPQWRRYLCWIHRHAQATLSYFFYPVEIVKNRFFKRGAAYPNFLSSAKGWQNHAIPIWKSRRMDDSAEIPLVTPPEKCDGQKLSLPKN
jgi:hypothetical protein